MTKVETVYFIILMFLTFMVFKTYLTFLIEELKNGGDDYEE